MKLIIAAALFAVVLFPSIAFAGKAPASSPTLIAAQVAPTNCGSLGYEATIDGDGYPSQVIVRVTNPSGDAYMSFYTKAVGGHIHADVCLTSTGTWGFSTESGHTFNNTVILAATSLLVT